MARSFAVTYDYLCPFARIAHAEVIAALDRGADWDVRFLAFSLAQVHAADGEPPVWERAPDASGTRGVLAHLWGLAVRECAPEQFAAFHLGVFGARHDDGADIGDHGVLTGVARAVGVDVEGVVAAMASGVPAARLAAEHTEAVERWGVFGVPTFISGERAVFVRLMQGDGRDLERVLEMLEWDNLNEFKRTRVPR